MKEAPRSNIPEELWTAYLATRFEVQLSDGNCVAISIGQPARGLGSQWRDCNEAFIVTAHNPFSQLLSPADNRQREIALLQQVSAKSYRCLVTSAVEVASDTPKKWPDERGILIFGATMPVAIRLAAKFHQHAIVRVPRVGVVECLPVNAGEERPQSTTDLAPPLV